MWDGMRVCDALTHSNVWFGGGMLYIEFLDLGTIEVDGLEKD
jgi:hypothetical protein